MSLVHDYHDERKARLIRLGARPCPGCIALRKEAAEQADGAVTQAALIDDYKGRILALEGFIRDNYVVSPFVEHTVDEPAPEPPKQLTVMSIVTATCRHFGRSYVDMIGQRRAAEVVFPRQVAMYLAKTLTTRSLPDIGRRMGDRDHTTILHAVRKIKSLVDVGDPVAMDIAAIRRALGVSE